MAIVTLNSLRVNRSGFTLIELLLVVIIVGAAYTLFIINFSTKSPDSLSRFSELKTYLLSLAPDAQSLSLRCYEDDCKSCYLYGENSTLLKGNLSLFDAKPKTFDYDQFGYLNEVQFKNEQCFGYEIYPNGSSSSFLVEKGDKFYLFSAFLNDAKVFENYDDAVAVMDPNKILPQDLSDFYNER